MKTIKKLLIISIITLFTFAVVSCDFFSKTTVETTAVETTIVTTESTETSLTISTTTISNTTELTTNEVTTTEITTAESTSLTTATTTRETTTVATTTYVNNSRIVIIAPTKLTYLVNDSINLNGMVVTYYDAEENPTVLNDMQYTVSIVDMSTYGQKTVTVTYGEYEAIFTIQVNLPSYYSSATNLSGSNLFLQLRTIIHNGFDGVSYGDARYILDETDADPGRAGYLILVYLGTSVSGVWDDGITWNREHVWPQSGMPVSASNSVTNMASDLQNLKPANPAENSSRGNKWFDYVPTTSSVAYEPRDEVKGDIARILLYMVVMYSELTLVDANPNIYSYQMGILSTILEWNQIDPVDNFEMNRNNVIYSYPYNRNPFIDYPDFADLIWD